VLNLLLPSLSEKTYLDLCCSSDPRLVLTKENTMADRRVTQSRKDEDGDITALCNPAEPWSPRLKANAIADIDNGIHVYFVDRAGYRTNVQVVDDPDGKYLRTTADTTSANNLDNLPDC
jgi:hypothetical protein